MHPRTLIESVLSLIQIILKKKLPKNVTINYHFIVLDFEDDFPLQGGFNQKYEIDATETTYYLQADEVRGNECVL